MDFKDWLIEKEKPDINREAAIVFGNSEKKVDLGDDACIWGAPGVQHGRSKGPIRKRQKK